jgi:outer membrane protein assembly factor BamB
MTVTRSRKTILLVSLIVAITVLPLTASALPLTGNCIQAQTSDREPYSLTTPPGVECCQIASQMPMIPGESPIGVLRRPLAVFAGSDWSNSGGDAQRNGQSTTIGPTSPEVLWSGGPSSLISWLPVTENNRLFIVRQTGWPGSQHDAPIYAFDLTTGVELWSIDIPYDTGDWTTWVGGVKNGIVYASRSGNGASVHDNLYALNASTGSTLWVSQTLIDAGPYDGIVFASNGDPIIASFMDIWRFNAQDGSVVWHAARLGSVSGSCGGALNQDAFYVADATAGGHILVRFNAQTGERLYQSDVMPGFTLQNTPFVGPDGTVYLCRTQNNTLVDFFYAFTDTGSGFTEKWQIPSAWTTFSEYATAPDGSVFVLIPGPRLAKVNSLNGSIIVQTDILTVDLSPAPHIAVDAAGTVFFSNGGFNHGKVIAFTPDLVELWSTPMQNINIGGPSLGNNGILILSGSGSNLRAYHRPLPSYQVNLSGGFLKVRGTVQNTGQVDVVNLSWNMTVTGGIFRRIHQINVGVIQSLPVQTVVNVSSGVLFGFGAIAITVSVDQLTVSAEARILGPFISMKST